MSNQLMTVADLAEHFQLSEASVRSLVKSNALPHLLVGNSVRFDPTDIKQWLNEKAAERKRDNNER